MPNDAVVAGRREQARWPDARASPPLGRGRPIAIAPAVTAETLESHADAADDRRRSDRHVILYLAFLSALMAVSIDTALPAFDEIRDHFGLTSADNRVSLIITSFFIGATLGHLFYGPFSDRFGRGPVLRAGMVVYALGALGATLAPSMTALLAFRFVWGLGAAGSGVLRVAIARDLYRKPDGARDVGRHGRVPHRAGDRTDDR